MWEENFFTVSLSSLNVFLIFNFKNVLRELGRKVVMQGSKQQPAFGKNQLKRLKKKTNFMTPFYGWGSTASRPEPLRGGSLLFRLAC